LGSSLSTLGAGNIGSIFSRIGDLSSAVIGIVVAFEGLVKIGVVLGKVGGIIGGVVAGVLAIGGAIAALPLAAVVAIVAAIGLAIAAIAYHWEPVKNALIAGWNWIGEQISRASYAVRTFLGINTELAEQQRQQREEEARAAEEAKQKAIKDAEEAGEDGKGVCAGQRSRTEGDLACEDGAAGLAGRGRPGSIRICAGRPRFPSPHM
jgi:hypothetical protein